MLKRCIKKALFKGAFFILVLSGFTACTENSAAFAGECLLDSHSTTEQVRMKWVYDGDTLLVTDDHGGNKRKVRIIGIDTPEVKHHKQEAQKYGAEATEHLRALLKKQDTHIVLEYDKTRYDRYKRTLAHVFLKDGTNVSEWLLQQGFAKTLVFPPNVRHIDCYKSAERKAQKNKRRLWQLRDNQPKGVGDLNKKSKGYIRLIGKVIDVDERRKSIYLVFEAKAKNKKRDNSIRVRIKKKNLRYFKDYNPSQLTGKIIIVSGYIKNKKGKKTITLSHGSQLELLTKNDLSHFSEKSLVSTIKWSLEK